MIDKVLSDKLVLFFDNYLSFYKKFLQLETDKFDSIANNRFRSINGLVKSEEAFILRSKGLEIERDKLIAQTEKPRATFRELISLLNSPQREKMECIYNELSQVLSDLKAMNRRCNCSIELRLHRIHTTIDKLDKHSGQQNVYTSQAGGGGELTGILYKKI